jgi:hypothetical protein
MRAPPFGGRVFRFSLQVCGGNGDGGHGRGFGAEDAWAKGDVGPGVGGEELHFFGGPAAFGSDG